MSNMFDPNAFLDQTTDAALERRPPVPALDYVATIQDLVAETWQSKDKYNEDGTLKSGLKFRITLDLQLPAEVQELCKIQKLTLTDTPLVDMTPDKTGIDYSVGKNGRLRQYREATGLNVAGQPFSPRMLIGRMVKVRVTHEEYQGNLQERVGAIGKAV
jgi:hypothetical protein